MKQQADNQNGELMKLKKILSMLIIGMLILTVFSIHTFADDPEFVEAAPELKGHEFIGETPLEYAACFKIYNYSDGYIVIDVPQSGEYLIVPEGGDIPETADDMVIIQQPVNRIYLAATSAMALFSAIDAVDNIRLSGADTSGWYIESAVSAMEAGDMLYAGKYSEPDYEMLIGEDCNLAIESTMIFHTPKVKEMIEDLDIPVFVDRSSYERHPLGKTEWIKLYAAIVGKSDQAEEFFKGQTRVIEELKNFENTEKTVAFFFVNTDGSIVVRNPEDYIPNMIEIAGGRYAFRDMITTETSASVSITMEEFYTTASDVDYIIYNGSINGPINSIAELIGKNALFADMKAVREGNVWTIDKEFYQRTDIAGQMIKDVNHMISGNSPDEMTFLVKVN